MTTFQDLIEDLKSARSKLISAINNFQKDMIHDKLFDDWSLKDVVAHLSGWDQLTVKSIKLFLKNKVPDWGGEINDFNKISVEKRKSWSWTKVYNEFLTISQKNIDAYESIPLTRFDEYIWKNKKYTPRKFLKIDIHHYEKEHLPQIQKYSR